MKMQRTWLLATLLWAALPSAAHDFWIEPSAYRAKVGQTVTLSLRVGEHFRGDPVPRSKQLMAAFVGRDAVGEWAIAGDELRDPAGRLQLRKDGLTIVGYRSKPYPLTLDAVKFEAFLKEEGLERISKLRASRGESNEPDREQFYRFAKSMIATGTAVTGFDRPLGFRFEIVPETNPMAATPLRVRLLLEGKPHADALLVAIHRDDRTLHVTARTDRQGRATLTLPKRGAWLVKSVEMAPAPAGTNLDWEGLWASLTFER